MDFSLLRDRIANLREEASCLRKWGAGKQAEVLETAADRFEEALRDWWHEERTVPQAVPETGYSAKQLRRMVREGRIPDSRPPGSRETIYIRRCDLPRKPPSERDEVSEVVEYHVERARRPSTR